MSRSHTPANQEGPTNAPPALPEGWLAQWEGQSRKYYYVQRATGLSQWDIPTQPALSVPTPDPTPQQEMDPFQKPPTNERGMDAQGDSYEGADRGFLSDLATNAMGGKQNKPQNQSGLGGLASSFLGGQGSHGGGGGGHGGSGGGLTGQLVGSLLGGGKPQNQQSSNQGSGTHASSSSGGYGQGGLMGLASGFLGGHHGSSGQGSNYGYSSTGQSSGGYSGEAPPVAYNPSASSSHQYGSSTAYGQSSTQHSMTPSTQGYSGSTHGQSHPGMSGPTAFGHPDTSYDSYGQHNHTTSGPTNTSYDSSHHQAPYSQQTPYQTQPQGPGYDQYPSHSQQGQFAPAPQNTPAYPAHQQGGYTPYGQQPSIGSHFGQQASDQGQYAGQHSGGGYPGQPNYGASGDQNYGQHQHGGYGQQGQYSSGGGAPPAPGWKA